MKELVLSFCLALVAIQVSAQTYVPLPLDSGNIWRFSYYSIYSGENVLGGNIVGEKTVDSVTWAAYQGNDGLGALVGLREEDRVIYFSPDFTLETQVALFDFNLEKGDFFMLGGHTAVEVVSVGSVNVAGEDRLAITVKNTFQNFQTNEVWVSGIGSLKTGVSILFTKLDFDTFIDPQLTCFSSGGQQLYPNEEEGDCQQELQWNPIGIEESNDGTKLVQAFPNPTTDHLTINFSAYHESTQVNVMDMFGRIVLTKTIQSGRSIDVSMLPAGMYIVRIIQDGISTSRTFSKL